MFKEKTILAVVPARGGSKGILRKNLSELEGLSLVARVATTVRSISWIDCAVISTDDGEILEEAKEHGLVAHSLRPAELSGDHVDSLSVWQHAFIEAEKKTDLMFDCSLLLEPTSPFRTVHDLEQTLQKLIYGRFDSVVTVSETDSKNHPLKQFKVVDGKLQYYNVLGKSITARQQLEPVFQRNGIAYAITRQCLLEQNVIVGHNSAALIIDRPLVNIDTEWDLELAKWLVGRR